ncbi:MarR family transcriptional regulator [Mycolicibacterium conceptionense]|jgi:DNA-binding MarR family transcriptional regulator|uniref:MarR family transcriptional regulator n=2 Tax=Mycolicibacterium TaxID=1866885 RepID=A0A0J8U7U2_9MYCO|nr:MULTISPECIES: MarR family transcriptional regulator [Mycolicibacterium]KLI06600.1 MarR family transcriptional regulator [Mycolicibacterium senegalense]KLO52572.1 MarR family transcriptional regulator [Mycolicibacterium senegalense]KMV17122.1 MarR family transcriptional regulator [Mycolicibacterium conceptionense]MCW1823482.1 MarR family transcriptional regulator [Mycolicibacterium senegalense]OBB05226.1 MarR family transcriptional regulator [Mycolicibacterium conceptionense]
MTRALSTAQTRAWRPYIESSLRLETLLDERLRETTGLALMDYHLLMLLAGAPDRRLRMSELAEKMVFSRSRITYQINSMTKRGLVLREPVPEDRRGYRAVLTASGADVLREAMPLHAASVRELFFDHIQPDELDCIERVFTRLHSTLQHDRQPDDERQTS